MIYIERNGRWWVEGLTNRGKEFSIPGKDYSFITSMMEKYNHDDLDSWIDIFYELHAIPLENVPAEFEYLMQQDDGE